MNCSKINNNIDLIITDLLMEKMNGDILCKNVNLLILRF